jgi:diacylglycerol kinase (ATP)
MARSAGELVLLLGTLVLVLIAELLNSAIEALADAVSLERHPLLGRAKDLGSAAVMLAIGVAAGAWLAIAWTR